MSEDGRTASQQNPAANHMGFNAVDRKAKLKSKIKQLQTCLSIRWFSGEQ